MRDVRAVLFDLDGTLVKSIELHYQAWASALMELGIALSYERYTLLEGTRGIDLASMFLSAQSEKKSSPEQLLHRKEELMGSPNFLAYDGVENLLLKLRASGIKTAIVTAALERRVKTSVSTNILNLFDVVVTAEKCSASKPDPAPYLKACELLGIQPSQSMVVENAPLGVASAKAAGCKCVALTTTVARSALGQADVVVDHISMVEDYVL